MNNYQQSFFVNGRFYGTFPRKARRDQDQEGRTEPPDSLLFFCTKCGEVYAKCPVVDLAGKQLRWRSIAGVCGKCPSDLMFLNPGNVWISWDWEYQTAMPKELLERELVNLIDFINSKGEN